MADMIVQIDLVSRFLRAMSDERAGAICLGNWQPTSRQPAVRLSLRNFRADLASDRLTEFERLNRIKPMIV